MELSLNVFGQNCGLATLGDVAAKEIAQDDLGEALLGLSQQNLSAEKRRKVFFKNCSSLFLKLVL